ncbi:protein ECT2-like isoform X2 [Actinia tenebrosa]|uniref:Protein ECT2-like isoform X2 n=1 Tax=Actinia tenebrosa TaxID=6105 RepID=A0A6P8ILJ1_ACTTE|nr:protein ECT2-like isoform X2 [Actinia tenebrosa]
MSEESSVESNDSPSRAEGSISGMETRVCIVGKKNFENEELLKALETLKIPTIKTEDTKDILKTINDEVETVFVCDPFEGEEFLNLHREEQRIIGPPVVLACAKNNLTLPYNSRPLYCSIMANHIICFTGFKKKEEMGKLCNLVHHMGGSIRGELSGRVTHLVASSVHGHKYGTAVSLGKPIMTVDWIYACWDKKLDLNVSASSDEMDKFKMAPFHGLSLSFYGFSDEEKKHMEESTEQQGGKFVDSSNASCTHVVVEDGVKELPDNIRNSSQTFVVKQEWFWASIHMDGCADESLYPFTSTPHDQTTKQNTPASVGRKRKRKKIKESDITDLLSPDSPLFKNKRKSGDLLSVSGSLLDYTLLSPATPVAGRGDATPSGTITPLSTPKPAPTARQQVTMELLQTEKNYVGILTTILKVFKEPLETDPRGPIVPTESIKTIFGSLPDILDVHTKIMEEIEAIISSWSEDKCIGKVILNHADVLCKVYPPFVNYFEMSKETVNKHDRENPRFHAFLKACLSKSECGRQSLAELLIRPVQRLPSMNLLLSDILKRTDKNNPDYVPLMQASDALKNVMMHINEDKRKTEGQVQMFEILRDVDGCPAYILSSHRSYVTKADTFELGDGVCGKGEPVTIFLFNDSLEMTKRRGMKINKAMKSPAAIRTPQKAYKHLEFIPLSHVRRVVNIRDNEDCQNLFGIIYRVANEMKEKLLMFRLINDDIQKEDWLYKLTMGLANTACTTDTENFVTTVDPQELMLSKSDLSTGGTLSRAVRVAKRTTRKVSRALSMNKTPRKSNMVRRSSSNVTPSREVFAGASPLATSSIYNQNVPIGLRGRAMSVCEGMDSELMDVDLKVRRSMSISEER